MRFSANLGFLWSDRPLLARMEAAARAGFRAVEMHWPYDVPASEVAAVARRNEVTLLGINTAPGNFAAGERGLGAIPGRERDFQGTIDQSIEYCRVSGATAIHVMAGNVAASDRERARAVFATNLRVAAAKAAAQQLTLLLEPLNPNDNPGYFYSTVPEAVSLIEELQLPNLKLQFDVYHVARAEGDVLAKLDRYRSHIGHVQIASVPARAEPDEGEIAYPVIFAAVEKLKYAGWVGCEYRPRGDTDEGLIWIDRMGMR
ncbi:MAG: 2-dehydrotetronate isomerase [Gammaproteobacteria bacterium]|jgi:hydroxypyruvate isomerase|nr:2-dehydrotetronate isomerase [Gammaproteobacteria bacterium]